MNEKIDKRRRTEEEKEETRLRNKAYRNKWGKTLYKLRSEMHQCTRCGVDLPKGYEKRQCVPCNEKMKEYYQKNYKRRQIEKLKKLYLEEEKRK